MEEKKSDTKQADTITIKKEDFWKYSTFFLLAVLVIGSFVVFTGDTTPTVNGNAVNPSANPTPAAQPSVVSADIDDDAILGDEDAPVTIIEFSDYQCPFCQRFRDQTLNQLKAEYIETGKANFVYRDFPLTSIHPQAQKAAEAAECVRAQGGDEAYFEMHDKLFDNIQSLSESNMKMWAQELGYNIDDCLDSGEFTAEVQADSADAQAAGGRGTPYFVVVGKDGKGQAVSGAQPFSAFKTVIDAKLAE